jgi:hypothetical protein
MRAILLFSLAALFVACEKNEIPVPKHTTSANVQQVSMGSDYANQLFFSLDQQAIISQNDRAIWDLGFESGANGWHIVLNGAKLMAAGKTTETALANVHNSDDIFWDWDRPSGNYDSTAIGDWRNGQQVYIIDRGVSTSGAPLGMVKVIFHASDADSYDIEWADLQTATSVFQTIQKNDNCNFTFFSFDNGGQPVTIEPAKTAWDLCFTTYTHVFEAHTPYLVNGVTANRSGVELAEYNAKPFAEIVYSDCLSTTFSDFINVIGYSWKTYDFDLSIYTVNSNRTFLVKTHENRYFKLRFLDFYDENGAKGAPSFELQELVP